MSNPTIWQMTLPSGTTYDIEDKTARAAAAGINMQKCTQASDTPYGVTWDNDGTTVTGTLVASSSTTGKFYLVPIVTEDGKDAFAEYVTVVNDTNPATYSWEKIGTTDIDLSDLGDLAYKDSASGTFTPEGTVSAPVISKTTAGETTNVTPFGSAGTLPGLTMTVSNGNLTIGFDPGTLPSGGTPVACKTGDAVYEAAAPSFSGTQGNVSVS